MCRICILPSFCADASAQRNTDAVRQTWTALFCPRFFSSGCQGAKCLHINSSSSALHIKKHTHTDTHVPSTRAHSQCSPRLYRRILFCYASLTVSKLPPIKQSTQRQSLNMNAPINSLTPAYELQKQRMRSNPRVCSVCVFPVPPSPSSSSSGFQLFSRAARVPNPDRGKHP